MQICLQQQSGKISVHVRTCKTLPLNSQVTLIIPSKKVGMLFQSGINLKVDSYTK